MNADIIQKLLTLRRAGLTYEQLLDVAHAAGWQCSLSHLHVTLRRHGAPVVGRGRRADRRAVHLAWLRARKAGQSCASIAAEAGVTRQAVSVATKKLACLQGSATL